MISKKYYYYFWQYPLDYFSSGMLHTMINTFNKKEKYLGYYIKSLYEDLITSVVNDLGKIPTTIKNNICIVNEEKLQMILGIEKDFCREFVEALINYGLIFLDEDKKSFYLTNIERFIGSNKYIKKSNGIKDDLTSLATRKQKRMYMILKSYGYNGSFQRFVSGEDKESINSFIEATVHSKIDLKQLFRSGLTIDDYISIGIDPKLFDGKIIKE